MFEVSELWVGVLVGFTVVVMVALILLAVFRKRQPPRPPRRMPQRQPRRGGDNPFTDVLKRRRD
jgi:hypothetical protein